MVFSSFSPGEAGPFGTTLIFSKQLIPPCSTIPTSLLHKHFGLFIAGHSHNTTWGLSKIILFLIQPRILWSSESNLQQHLPRTGQAVSWIFNFRLLSSQGQNYAGKKTGLSLDFLLRTFFLILCRNRSPAISICTEVQIC